MRNSALAFVVLGLTQMGSAAAQQAWPSATAPVADARQVSCLNPHPSTRALMAACAQLAASSTLRPRAQQRPAQSSTRALRGAGKGALIGLGVGLGVGGIAALLFGGECEEGHAGCTAGLIVGGAALGAGVGAVVGAGRD
jgi:hypothetical protein